MKKVAQVLDSIGRRFRRSQEDKWLNGIGCQSRQEDQKDELRENIEREPTSITICFKKSILSVHSIVSHKFSVGQYSINDAWSRRNILTEY